MRFEMSVPALAIIGVLGGVTLTNEDDHAHSISVSDHPGRVSTMKLAPGERRQGFCVKGCTLALGTGAAYVASGVSRITIYDDAFESTN